ncbi:MAG TPA: acyl carrier protein [Bacteroidales bacterium]|nr:acyl carrier protein [Bacteroidales bacterium]
MEKKEIQNLVVSEIRKVKKNLPESIPPEAHLMNEIGFDSVDMAELVARAEQSFKIEIPDSIWKQLVTINIITDYIFEQVKNRTSFKN